MTTLNFRQYFPYPSIRDQQGQILDKLEANWNKYKVFVIDAPTGVGKSGIAISLGSSERCFLLTESKSLQDQYLKEFPTKVKSIKGKSNYICVKNDDFTVESSPCQVNQVFVKRCLETHSCLYYKARADAKIAQILLTNYNYFYLSSKSKEPNDRPLIICDEGHVLSEKLADMTKIVLSLRYLLKNFQLQDIDDVEFNDADTVEDIIPRLKKISQSLVQARIMLYEQVAQLHNIYINLTADMTAEEMQKEFEDCINSARLFMDSLSKDSTETLKKISTINNYCTNLEFFLEYSKDSWVLDVDKEDNKKITISPVDARRVFKNVILSKCERVVLLSASIGSVASLADELGLETDEICYITTDSPFDPSKSPIIIEANYDFSHKGLEYSLPHALKYIDTILDIYHDQKGIIHAGNYKITNYVLKNSKHRERLIGRASDDFSNNGYLFEQHAASDKPTVLVSPSMHTGIDLKGDLSAFQVIVKFPFSSLADKRTKIKMERSSIWYSNETWKKIIQASGRSIRTQEDSAVTFILDKSFHYQFKIFRSQLPKWFKDRIVFGDE